LEAPELKPIPGFSRFKPYRLCNFNKIYLTSAKKEVLLTLEIIPVIAWAMKTKNLIAALNDF